MKAREDNVTDYGLERKDGTDNTGVNVAASPTCVQPSYLAKEMKCLSLHEHFPMQKADLKMPEERL